MNTHVITIDTIDAWRRQVQHALRVGPRRREAWAKCRKNIGRAIAVFPNLRMKQGYVLRGYLFTAGGNGNGVVWALPADSPWPEPDACPKCDDAFESPRPDGVLPDYMDAIDGDGTPISYMSASLLARELAEFGALWHGCGWSVHRILGSNPLTESPAASYSTDRPSDIANWTWKSEVPTEWQPVVEIDHDSVRVTFHTFTGLGEEAILRHVDVFTPGRYSFRQEEPVAIATGSPGYVF